VPSSTERRLASAENALSGKEARNTTKNVRTNFMTD
jgi:hypothetical protein